jgi:hypothetical protein
MGASRQFLAACLAGVLSVPATAFCTPAQGRNPIINSDAPAHPGLKSADAVSQRSYGDEPGDTTSSHGHHDHSGDGIQSDTNQSATGQLSASTHGSIHSRVSAQSAVLDTLGVVHDGGGMGGSDALGLGLTVRLLTSAERQNLGLDTGLLVTGVTAGMGLKAGFQPGDVVLSLDGVGLTSADQFLKLTQKLPHDRPVPVLVHRPNSNLFLPLGAPSSR